MRGLLLPVVVVVALGCRGNTLEPDTDIDLDSGTDVDVDTTASGTLSGEVQFADGEPVDGAIVSVQGLSTTSGTDGGFAFDELEPGAATVVATLDGYISARADVVIIDGQATTSTLILEAVDQADLLVTALSGVPLPVARAGSAELLATVSTDAALTWEWTVTGDFAVSDDGGGTATLTAPDIPSATGEVTATAMDADGNSDVATLLVNTVPNAVPVIESLLASQTVVSPSGVVDVTAVATDSDDAQLVYDWDVPLGWSFSGADGAVTVTAPTEYGQSAAITLEVTDEWGASAVRSVAVSTADNGVPVITSVRAQPNPAQPGQAVELTVTATDPNGDELSASWTVDSAWAPAEDGFVRMLTAPQARGVSETASVVVTDASGATATASLNIATTPNLGPVIASIVAVPDGVEPNGTVDVSVSASDPNGDPLTITWAPPAGWAVDDATAASTTLTAGSDEGTATIDVSVEDAYGGRAEASVAIEVSGTYTAPEISLSPIEVFAFGQARPITALVNDADGDNLDIAWSIVGDGWSVTGTGAVGELTAPLPGGDFATSAVLIVSATDGTSTATATAPVTVVADGASCQSLADAGEPSGAYWLDPDGSAVNAYAAACDMDDDGNAWTLVYKRSSGVVRSDLPGDFATGTLNAYDLDLADRDQETEDFAIYRLPAQWSEYTEARVEVVDGGEVVQWMTYDTANSTPSTFFAKDRLLESSWQDMVPEHVGNNGGLFWSTLGEPDHQRRWYVNRAWGGCPNDEGWLIVQGDSDAVCPFDVANTILYSAGDGVENLTTGNVERADAMLVWVRQAAPGVSRADAVPTCSDLPDTVTEDGRYWVDPDGEGGSAPFRALCDVENGGWTLAYKKSSGVETDPSALWLGGDTGVFDPDALDRDAHVADYANSAITTGWSSFSEARVEVLVGGEAVQALTFDLTGDNAAWFTAASMTSTTWTDLATSSTNYFGIVGHNELRRRFFVNQNYGGCGVDVGWLIASGSTPVCSWETPYTVKYAVPAVQQNWTTGEIGVADALAVFLR